MQLVFFRRQHPGNCYNSNIVNFNKKVALGAKYYSARGGIIFSLQVELVCNINALAVEKHSMN